MADGSPAQGPSEDEIRAMMAQMREAPAEEMLADVANMLIQAAQVKLGRPDARLLIDAVAAVADAVGERARGGLAAQVAQAVTQLRLAQVEAERELGTEAPAAEPAAAGPAPGPAAAAPPPAAPSPPPGQGSRLWVPGR